MQLIATWRNYTVVTSLHYTLHCLTYRVMLNIFWGSKRLTTKEFVPSRLFPLFLLPCYLCELDVYYITNLIQPPKFLKQTWLRGGFHTWILTFPDKVKKTTSMLVDPSLTITLGEFLAKLPVRSSRCRAHEVLFGGYPKNAPEPMSHPERTGQLGHR